MNNKKLRELFFFKLGKLFLKKLRKLFFFKLQKLQKLLQNLQKLVKQMQRNDINNVVKKLNCKIRNIKKKNNKKLI